MAGLSPQNKLIAFVSNNAWSVYNFRLDVIRHLLQQGYQVMVIAPDDQFSPFLTQAGCTFIPIDFNNKSANPFHDLAFYRQLKQLYARHRPDFIFHYVAKPNIYGSMAAAAIGIPSVAVITGLGYPFAKRNWLYWTLKQLYRKALRSASEVWFLNNEDAQVFIKENIVDIRKVKVLPGEGVNTQYFIPGQYEAPQKKDDQVFTFLMSTRLLKSKGVGLYADAARILRKKNYAVRFELIGFFETHHPDSILQEELQGWQDEGLIEYNGFTMDVRPFLQAADCFVFPSFYNEGVPRCLMEAASMELPIITTFNRGCKELVLNNSTGFICKSQDPFDLADKMERMIQLSPEDRARIGKNGRSLVIKKFGVEHVIREYVDTLQFGVTD